MWTTQRLVQPFVQPTAPPNGTALGSADFEKRSEIFSRVS
jgi:hypothetical protein